MYATLSHLSPYDVCHLWCLSPYYVCRKLHFLHISIFGVSLMVFVAVPYIWLITSLKKLPNLIHAPCSSKRGDSNVGGNMMEEKNMTSEVLQRKTLKDIGIHTNKQLEHSTHNVIFTTMHGLSKHDKKLIFGVLLACKE